MQSASGLRLTACGCRISPRVALHFLLPRRCEPSHFRAAAHRSLLIHVCVDHAYSFLCVLRTPKNCLPLSYKSSRRFALRAHAPLRTFALPLCLRIASCSCSLSSQCHSRPCAPFGCAVRLWLATDLYDKISVPAPSGTGTLLIAACHAQYTACIKETADYFACSQVWLPTVQLVLHADWQDVWHSPHPPSLTLC